MQKARNRTHYKRTHCFTTQIFRLGLGNIAAERVCVSSIHLRTLGVVGLRQLLELQLRWVRERSSLAYFRVRKVREVFVYFLEKLRISASSFLISFPTDAWRNEAVP